MRILNTIVLYPGSCFFTVKPGVLVNIDSGFPHVYIMTSLKDTWLHRVENDHACSLSTAGVISMP